MNLIHSDNTLLDKNSTFTISNGISIFLNSNTISESFNF